LVYSMTKMHKQIHLKANLPQEKKINMLLAGLGSVGIVKTMTSGLKMLPEAARPRSQFFTIRTSQPANDMPDAVVVVLRLVMAGFYELY